MIKRLEAITVCCNYSDFLAWSALANKHIFDRWVVVTDTKDYKTHQICLEHGLTCVKTDIFYANGGFNKYRGINEGLKHITKTDWVLFLDGDIVLPHIAKRVLRELDLDPTVLYGIDRVNIKGLPAFADYMAQPSMNHENWLLNIDGLEMGARIVHYFGQAGDNGRYGGWKPLGFFQLAHSSQFTTYPESSLYADHDDILFANHWTRTKRCLIPEIVGLHLESDDAVWGQNWKGRRSAPFAVPGQKSAKRPPKTKVERMMGKKNYEK
jgi:glycosyltransferase involved in cell wall biosynthesis